MFKVKRDKAPRVNLFNILPAKVYANRTWGYWKGKTDSLQHSGQWKDPSWEYHWVSISKARKSESGTEWRMWLWSGENRSSLDGYVARFTDNKWIRAVVKRYPRIAKWPLGRRNCQEGWDQERNGSVLWSAMWKTLDNLDNKRIILNWIFSLWSFLSTKQSKSFDRYLQPHFFFWNKLFTAGLFVFLWQISRVYRQENKKSLDSTSIRSIYHDRIFFFFFVITLNNSFSSLKK